MKPHIEFIGNPTKRMVLVVEGEIPVLSGRPEAAHRHCAGSGSASEGSFIRGGSGIGGDIYYLI